MKARILLLCTALIGLVSGCATTQVDNVAGQPTVYEDPDAPSQIRGVGIESRDIVGLTDKMMRDMLSNQVLAGRETPPRIIIDNEYLINESTSVLNTNILTDRLRTELNRAANGRMVFVARHFSAMVAKERQLKRDGTVDGGTIRQTQATAGADFRLGGRITSLDRLDPSTQLKERYHYVSFEMIDLELGTIPWSNSYEIRKTTQDNVIYR